MCRPDKADRMSSSKSGPASDSSTSNNGNQRNLSADDSSKTQSPQSASPFTGVVRRRGKREKQSEWTAHCTTSRTVAMSARTSTTKLTKKKKQSKSLQRHGQDAQSGGMDAIIPSFIGLTVLVVCVMAHRGFRGRASVAGIDLGTTHSVVCVQAPSKSVGEIECIPDPLTGSPIIPSVVSFLLPEEEQYQRQQKKSFKNAMTESSLSPHPSQVVIGRAAKRRIDTHPHHTLYNAKRVMGRGASDPAVQDLRQEVEFSINCEAGDEGGAGSEENSSMVSFQVDDMLISPPQVGSYIVYYLMEWTKQYLQHDNVHSAVIAVPAKFDSEQRMATMMAFKRAGVKVTRVLEEPTAAALAYGLDKKDGVELILVYDFGGGTLDISILHVADGGFVDVLGSDGDDRLGGADFDAAVAHLLLEKHEDVIALWGDVGVDPEELSVSCPNEITITRPLCTVSSFHTIGEQLKISLSEQLLEKQNEAHSSEDADTTVSSSDLVADATCLSLPKGYTTTKESTKAESLQDLCSRLVPTPLRITLAEYDQVSTSLYERALLPAWRLLKDLSLSDSDMDEIVLVGGTTRMPQIRSLVQSAFSHAPLNTHIDPDLTVAYGAASVND